MILRLAILILAAHLLTACAQTESDEDPVTVGLIVPFDLHRDATDAVELAVVEINAAGGFEIAGQSRQLRVVSEDSEREPGMAVRKAMQLINQEDAVALLGLPRSINAIPVGGLAEQNKVPLVSTMSTHPATTAGKQYVWRLAVLNAIQAEVLASFAFDDLGARRAAALVDAADTYSTDLTEVFRRVFETRGGQMVAFETFTEDAMDVEAELRRVAANEPDILLMPNYSSIVERHAALARRVGIEATFLGGDSWSMMSYAVRDREAIVGAYFSDYWAPDQDSDPARAFIDSYRERFDAEPSTSAALTYDAMMMIASVIRERGASDPQSIRDGLAALESYRGVTGTITFAGSADPRRSTFIRKIDPDGEIRLHKEIKPEASGAVDQSSSELVATAPES